MGEYPELPRKKCERVPNQVYTRGDVPCVWDGRYVKCHAHNVQIHRCGPCGGSSMCPCGTRRHRCTKCRGSSVCEHGKRKNHCAKCDPAAHLGSCLRTRLLTGLKAKSCKKAYSTLEYLGCSFYECKKYLEAQFKEGMTWKNHGKKGWHVDHIRPVASFDLKDPEQVKKCFHYTNLQPLWWRDNLTKGAKTAGVLPPPSRCIRIKGPRQTTLESFFKTKR